MQNINKATPVLEAVREEIFDIKRRFAEEFIGTLIFEREEAALDDADALRCDVAIF